MNTEEVEKVIKRKFKHGVSLQEQTTPEEWAEICFWSEMEIEIITEKQMAKRTETDVEIEKRVKAKWQKRLTAAGGDHDKALKERENDG